MLEFYAEIKSVHVAAVSLSGALFALRGLTSLAGARWPMAPAVRYLSYGVDTVLLTAALMLLTVLPGAVFANHWLNIKLALLVGYIVLGVLTLRLSLGTCTRGLCLAGALALFALMVGIALAHHPLGWLRLV